MKTSHILLLTAILSLCLGCVKPPAGGKRPYPVVAQLNTQPWFGNATAVKTMSDSLGSSCDTNSFSLFIKTDLLHPGDTPKPEAIFTGCMTLDCLPTQRITIYNIPLRKGKYNLASLSTCNVPVEHTPYVLLLYKVGSGIYQAYERDLTRTSWISITQYDSASGLLEGRFSLTLQAVKGVGNTSRTPARVRFQKGRFSTRLTNVLSRHR